jgi:hypothetical protein
MSAGRERSGGVSETRLQIVDHNQEALAVVRRDPCSNPDYGPTSSGMRIGRHDVGC